MRRQGKDTTGQRPHTALAGSIAGEVPRPAIHIPDADQPKIGHICKARHFPGKEQHAGVVALATGRAAQLAAVGGNGSGAPNDIVGAGDVCAELCGHE